MLDQFGSEAEGRLTCNSPGRPFWYVSPQPPSHVLEFRRYSIIVVYEAVLFILPYIMSGVDEV